MESLEKSGNLGKEICQSPWAADLPSTFLSIFICVQDQPQEFQPAPRFADNGEKAIDQMNRHITVLLHKLESGDFITLLLVPSNRYAFYCCVFLKRSAAFDLVKHCSHLSSLMCRNLQIALKKNVKMEKRLFLTGESHITMFPCKEIQSPHLLSLI